MRSSEDQEAERPIEDIKARIGKGFIGKAGVHGVGIRRSLGAVCLYVDDSGSDAFRSILKQIETAAVPYKVVVIEEERPTIT